MNGYSLIKRLRTMAATGWNSIGNEAADRIEELEAALAAPSAGAEAVARALSMLKTFQHQCEREHTARTDQSELAEVIAALTGDPR